eukprot:5484369-Amphidinium_carterae.1
MIAWTSTLPLTLTAVEDQYCFTMSRIPSSATVRNHVRKPTSNHDRTQRQFHDGGQSTSSTSTTTT